MRNSGIAFWDAGWEKISAALPARPQTQRKDICPEGIEFLTPKKIRLKQSETKNREKSII